MPVEVNWMKDGTIILPSEEFRVESEGAVHTLVILKADLLKAGTYTASIMKGVETTALLLVIGIQKYPFLLRE